MAKARAEKLFGAPRPASPPTPLATKPVEPTLEQRLADIDRRARARAIEEKRQLADHYLMSARAKLKKALYNTTDVAVRTAFAEVNRLEQLTGASGDGAIHEESPVEAVANGRVRRSQEDLTSDARKLVAYLRDHPGSRGSEAAEGAGVTIKPPLNVRTFIERFLPDVKLRVDGQKAGTTYTIA